MATRGSSAKELAYERLKHGIVTLEYRPSEKVDEVLLASAFGVSRTPVREALQKLEADGLIVTGGSGRYVVADMNLDHIKSLFEAQVVVESAVAQLLVARIDEEKIALIEQATVAVEEAIESRDPALIAERNSDLHLLETTLTGNRYLVDLSRKIHLHLQRVAFLCFGGAGTVDGAALNAHYERVKADHRDFLDALRAGDHDAARDHTMAHIELFKERTVEYLAESTALQPLPSNWMDDALLGLRRGKRY